MEANFRIIGYLPSWYGKPHMHKLWDKLTHVNYAFAIPTKDAEIRSFEDPDFVYRLIENAHEHNVKVGLSVGGWEYEHMLLEDVFVEATNTYEKVYSLADHILEIIDCFDFDGVDMDWEYPRVGVSSDQYELLMTVLRCGLDLRGKFLSAAVIANSDVALGQTDKVLAMLDWVNVMAYDGDSGAGHSPYSFAVSSGEYWINTRGLPPEKVVLGVPFYARPEYVTYADIVANDVSDAIKDTTDFNGTTIYYNGLKTITDKTIWACNNAGGIMIWELMQDTSEEIISLLNQIYSTVQNIC